MSVKCFEDEKHYIVETANWCLDAAITAAEAARKYAWNTSPNAFMRKGHLGQQFIQKGVNQTEILELHCFFLTQTPKVFRVIRPIFVCLFKQSMFN